MKDDSVCLRTVSFHILLIRLWRRNISRSNTLRERDEEKEPEMVACIVTYLSVSSRSATLAAGVAAVGAQGGTLHRVRGAGGGGGAALREAQAPAVVLLTLQATFKDKC